jgi:4-amino-4-deoxy-L-arabinose transferase-like glycosyltransferase
VGGIGRIGLALWLPNEPTVSDGRRYNRIAANLIEEGVFGINEKSAPLHPLLLTAVYSLTGIEPTAGRILTALIGLVTCLLVYRLGVQLHSRAAGLLAAAILALYPIHVYTSALFEYPTCLFIMLLTATVSLLISAVQNRNSLLPWGLAGLTLGLAALTVPTILTAAPFIALWLLFGFKMTLGKAFLRVSLLTATCCIAVFAWSAYWFAYAEEFRLIAAYGGQTMFKGNCALAAEYGNADISVVFAEEGVDPQTIPAYAEYIEVHERAKQADNWDERDQIYREAARRFWRERPDDAIRFLGSKMLRYWLPYAQPISHQRMDSLATRVVQAGTFVPIALLALVGTYLLRHRWRELVFVYVVIVSLWLTYSVFIVSARYRSQTDPLLIVLASCAIVYVTQAWFSKQRHTVSVDSDTSSTTGRSATA